MLLLSISFIINTSIFSLSLFIVFCLIKGHTAIFNNLHFYTLKKKIYIYIYTRKISEIDNQ